MGLHGSCWFCVHVSLCLCQWVKQKHLTLELEQVKLAQMNKNSHHPPTSAKAISTLSQQRLTTSVISKSAATLTTAVYVFLKDTWRERPSN